MLRTTLIFLGIGLGVLGLYARPIEKASPAKRTQQTAARVVPVFEFAPGSAMKVTAAFENTSPKDFKYLQLGGKRSIRLLDLVVWKDGQIVQPYETPCYAAPSRKDVRTLAPGKSIFYSIDLHEVYRDLTPGRYELRAGYHLQKDDGLVKEFHLTPLTLDCTVAYIRIIRPIESLPKKLSPQTRFRFTRVEEKSRYVLGADVGLGPPWDGKSTLFFAVRVSDAGKTKLKEPPESILRPLRVDPKSKIETMVYDPFPNSEDAIIQIHVLVTEPNKRQHHLVVDLTETGNPKLPTIKKNETLKAGTRYMLHKTKLGHVKLVPRSRK